MRTIQLKLCLMAMGAVCVCPLLSFGQGSAHNAAVTFYGQMAFETMNATAARILQPEGDNQGPDQDPGQLFQKFETTKGMILGRMETYTVLKSSEFQNWGIAAIKVEKISNPASAASAQATSGTTGANQKTEVSYQPLYAYKSRDGWKVILPSMLNDAFVAKLKNKDFIKAQEWYAMYKTGKQEK